MYDAKMEELRPLFTCTLCLDLFVEPVRLKKCGHTFCHFCLVKHFRKNSTCAKCNQSLASVGHRNYSTDLQFQEMAYRCFPDEIVNAMRKRLELISDKKSIIYQICATNLVYLLQHHVSFSSGKVRLRIRLDNRKFEMIVRCEHDIPICTIKKLFARKFQLPISSLNFLSSNSICLKDEDTVSDMILLSGGFDGQTPILIIANLIEDRIEEDNLMHEMPILEAESYEFDAPSPIVPLLEAALPTTSAQEDDIKVDVKLEEPKIEQMSKRKINNSESDDSRPPKIRKINQSTPPSDLISYFNNLQMPSPSASSTPSSIFASPKPEQLFQQQSPFPFIPPHYLQMLAAQQSAMRQHMMVPPFPQQFPNMPNIPMQNQRDAYDIFMKFLQMNQIPVPKIKKPGATVKPMRRNEKAPTTPIDNRPNDSLIDNFKNGQNVTAKEGDEHLRKLLSCPKI